MTNLHLSSRATLLMLLVGAVLAVVLLVQRSAAQGLTAKQQTGERPAVTSGISLRLENYVAGFNRPVGIANAGDMRLFVLEQAGRIRIIHEDGSVQANPFLDIRNRVDDSGPEKGLLGLAFHPHYFENGHFYVNYTARSSGVLRTRISRFSVSANPDIADASSEKILLTVDQPYANHNAGRIAFGPDGYLYIPLGDGGSGGDPGNYAQDETTLLGKISRIDVDSLSGGPSDCKGFGTGEYTVPNDNPLVSQGGACDEIWASGLRNPWQSTFDLLTGDLYIADVGQSKVEEVNFQPAASAGGENYGWRCYEGDQTYNAAGCGAPDTYTFPIFAYQRPSGYGDCSVTGGYVYRGQTYSALYGRYFLTDYCSGRFWDLQRQPDGNWQSTAHADVFPPDADTSFGNASFGQRCDGELFVANVEQGKIFALTGYGNPDSTPAATASSPIIDADYWAYLPLASVSNCR
jgi:glucose/arabinose dehydrogenase